MLCSPIDARIHLLSDISETFDCPASSQADQAISNSPSACMLQEEVKRATADGCVNLPAIMDGDPLC